MSDKQKYLNEAIHQAYQHGFVTDIDAEMLPPGLNEDVIRLISLKKEEPEFMLEWRLKAYRHWLTLSRHIGHTLNMLQLIIKVLAIILRQKSAKA